MFPNIVYTPKTTLKATDQSSIDSILKDLKRCARRLHTAFQFQQTELKILERLYYKGKNQHRSTLFWRRIEEIRRYALRLTRQNTYFLVEGLRLSFWGPMNEQTRKNTKAAWTHSPDPKSVELILERLLLVHKLLMKMHGTLQRTYDHLNLNLQTGAFLQLILTLSAITSRLAALCDELRLSIEAAWEVCYQLLQLFDPTRTKRTRSLFKRCPETTSPVIPSCKGDVSNPTPSGIADVFEDDVGSSIQRTSLDDLTGGYPQNTVPSDETHAYGEDVVHIDASLGLNFVTTTNEETLDEKPGVVRKTVDKDSLQDDTTKSYATNQRKSHSQDQKSERKSKKKKKDEIDDIFGF